MNQYHWTRFLSAVTFLALILALLPAASAQRPGGSDKIEPALLDELAIEGQANFFAIMAEQADLSGAQEIADWNARGWYVYNVLNEVASRTQAATITYAQERGLGYRSFLSLNAVYIERGDVEAAYDLAALPGVASLRLEQIEWIEPDYGQSQSAPQTYGWNLDTLQPSKNLYGMQAAQVWAQYGVHGESIVVGSIDTGAYYVHEAIDRQYRGNLTGRIGGPYDHNYNWWDPINGRLEPYDGNCHGTGVTGIMVGENPDQSEQVGVAPQARWTACKGCKNSGGCPQAALLECFDFHLAPWDLSGANPDPSKRPHIVNNSWGTIGCRTIYQAAIRAWVAAGVFPAFAAGNTPGCGTVSSPADNPEAFGTAAHDSTGTNLYAEGPSCFFDPPSCDPYAHEIDPHLNAPTHGRTADNVCPDCYRTLGGTSGASPHTAGTVALIWSGNPDYIGHIYETFYVLEQSTNHDVPLGNCGKPPCAGSENWPNYAYGWGYLDTLAAVTLAGVVGRGYLQGTVTEFGTGVPLQDITVTAERMGGGDQSITTDASGYYTMPLIVGTYTVTAEGPQHSAATVSGIVITTDTVTTQDFQLVPKGLLYGYVTDADSGAPLTATVSADDGTFTSTNPATGYYQMYLDEGTYDVTAKATDYASQTVTLVIPSGGSIQQDFQLLTAIAVVPDPISATLELFQWTTVDSVMTNNMGVDYGFQFIELGPPPGKLRATSDVLLLGDDADQAGWDTYRNALTAAGVTWDGNYQTVWLGVNFHNGLVDQAQRDQLMSNVLGLFLGGDVPWYASSIVSGTVPAGGSLGWTNYLTASPALGVDQPGQYQARLRIIPDNPDHLSKEVAVIMNVLPTANMGRLEGIVTSDCPGGPLEAQILIEGGTGPYTVTSEPLTGYYSYWLDQGNYNVTASAAGHVSETVALAVVAGLTTTQDFELDLLAPGIVVTPPLLEETLELGLVATQILSITNDGLQPLEYEIFEIDNGYIPQALCEEIYGDTSNTSSGGTRDRGNIFETTEGTVINEIRAYLNFASATDMAFVVYEGDVLEGTYNKIHENWLPSVGPGRQWYSSGPIAVRAEAGKFYYVAASWNASADYYRSNEPTPITTNCFGILHTGIPATLADYPPAETINNTYGSGDFSPYYFTIVTGGVDVPWLSEDPISGTVAVSDTAAVEVTFDANVVPGPGIYMADLHIQHNDPLTPTVVVPVTMTVLPNPDVGYLEGIVTGGGYCDGKSYPLEADVLIENAAGMTWTLISDPASGYFSRWLLADTYTVTASAVDHLDGWAVIQVTPQQTTTMSLMLRYIESCMDLDPRAFSETLPLNTRFTDTLTISNSGAGDLDWQIQEAVPWVHVTPTSGLVRGDNATDVSVVLDTAGLSPGQCYNDNLDLLHDDPGWGSPVPISLALCVEGPIFHLSKEAAPVQQYPGSPVTYTIVWGNEGDPATGVVISDVLPLEVEFAWATPVGTYYSATHEVVWGPLDLGTGERITATVVVTIGVQVTPCTWMTNTVYLLHEQVPPLMAEAWHHAQAPCTELASITISGPSSGYPGTYTFTTGYEPPEATPPIGYLWDNGDSTATSTRFLDVGSHILVVTAINCTDTVVVDSHTIVISTAVVCTEVTGVDLSVVTTGTIYPNDPVDLSADILPDDATKPYSYTVDGGPAMSASADPLTFTLTFATPGTHTVEIAVWNCQMTVPVTDSVDVVVAPAGWTIYLPLVTKNYLP